MSFPCEIGILGGGTWATALAKIMLKHEVHINWYMCRADQIPDFKKTGHNLSYLSIVEFNLDRITFYTDINEIVNESDTLLLAVLSLFLKTHLEKLNVVIISDKFVTSAIKGIIYPENLLVTDYLTRFYNVPEGNIVIIGGPCHTEEIAQERLTCPTIVPDEEKGKILVAMFTCRFVKASLSNDVDGVKLAAVLTCVLFSWYLSWIKV